VPVPVSSVHQSFWPFNIIIFPSCSLTDFAGDELSPNFYNAASERGRKTIQLDRLATHALSLHLPNFWGKKNPSQKMTSGQGTGHYYGEAIWLREHEFHITQWFNHSFDNLSSTFFQSSCKHPKKQHRPCAPYLSISQSCICPELNLRTRACDIIAISNP
jgi:hypothetical protein